MAYKSLRDAFEKNTNRGSSNECWPWTGSIASYGYGRVKYQYVVYSAHRLSHELFIGPIPDDKPYVLHSCDNPQCVNPAHLRVGTQTDNMGDMANRDRAAPYRGEEHIGSKLTNEAVLKIRRLYATNGCSQRKLAGMFSVSQRVIGKIVRREKWTHI